MISTTGVQFTPEPPSNLALNDTREYGMCDRLTGLTKEMAYKSLHSVAGSLGLFHYGAKQPAHHNYPRDTKSA